MKNFCLHLFKYFLIPLYRDMNHLMFNFIFHLDLKNFQTINKRKTKDYNEKIQK